MSSGHRRGRRILLATLVLAALVPLGPSPAAAVSTECDDLADTEIPADARIGDFGPGRFLADVDGDQHRDVVTGYVIGGPRRRTGTRMPTFTSSWLRGGGR